VFFWSFFCETGLAQPVLSQSTTFYEQLAAFPLTALSPPPGLMHWGPVDVHGRVDYLFNDGTGILAAPGQTGKTIVQTVTPDFRINIGSNWLVDYAPSFTFYSSPLFKDSTGQALTLTWATTYDDWALHLNQIYSDTTAPNIEFGGQLEQTVYTTSFAARRALNSQFALSSTVSQNISSSANALSSDVWSLSEGLTDEINPKMSAGINLEGSYQKVNFGASLLSETISGELHLMPGQKLAADLTGGMQDSQYIGLAARSIISPIYSADIHYQLTKTTTIGLVAMRSVSSSLFVDQLQDSTSVTASFNQRLLKHLTLILSGGYTDTPYVGPALVANPYVPVLHPITQPTTAIIQTTRSDKSTFYRASLAAPFLQSGQVSVFYSVSKNTSTVAGYSFLSHQIGFELSYGF
jgi:hypothetical protein